MHSSPSTHRRIARGWAVLRIVLGIEAAAGVLWLAVVIPSFFGASEDPLGARVSVLLAALISVAWVAATCVGAWRGTVSWVRGSALTIHVLMFAAATGVLQGIFGEQFGIGLALLACSLVGFIAAVIAKPAVRDPDAPDADTNSSARQ